MFGLFRAKSASGSRERRRHERMPIQVPAMIVLSRQKSVSCQTIDISTSGAKLDVPRDRMLPGEFDLVIPARKIRRRARLAWRGEEMLGVQFL